MSFDCNPLVQNKTPHENPILALLHDRMVELFRYGAYKIWFKVIGTENCELGTVLGYNYEVLDDLLRCSGLISDRGYALMDKWGSRLHLKVTVVAFYYGDNTDHEKWIRLEESTDMVHQIRVPGEENDESWIAVRPKCGMDVAFYDEFLMRLHTHRGIRNTPRFTKDIMDMLDRYRAHVCTTAELVEEEILATCNGNDMRNGAASSSTTSLLAWTRVKSLSSLT